MIDFDTWLKDNTPREVAYNRADMERGWNGAMAQAQDEITALKMQSDYFKDRADEALKALNTVGQALREAAAK